MNPPKIGERVADWCHEASILVAVFPTIDQVMSAGRVKLTVLGTSVGIALILLLATLYLDGRRAD